MKYAVAGVVLGGAVSFLGIGTAAAAPIPATGAVADAGSSSIGCTATSQQTGLCALAYGLSELMATGSAG